MCHNKDMKEIKDKLLIEKYSDSISSYVHLDHVSLQMFEFEKGELLIQPSFHLHSIYFLVKGSVNVYSIQADGRQFVTGVKKEIPILGDIEFVTKKKPHLFVEALENVVVLSIDTLRYEKELNADVLFLHSVIHSCVDIIQTVQHDQNFMSLEEKLIAYMKYQCDDHILRRIEKTSEILHCSRRQLQRIFLDVDGTLIDYDAKLPASAAKAVDMARANGHKVYICTGCSKAEVLQRNLCDLDGMIGGNGAYVEDHNEVVMHQGLSKEDVKHIVDWCNERHLGFYLEANSGMYCNDYMLEQGPETMVKYAQGKGADLEKAKGSSKVFMNGFIHLQGEDLYRDDVNKISFILSSYQDHLDSKVEFPNLIANTWGGKGELALYGDLGPTGITKRHAIEVLMEHLGADFKDTISFGDAKIDLSMFECCAYNVAMGNGGPEIKEAADYITTDVNDDGLYNAFKHLGLI